MKGERPGPANNLIFGRYRILATTMVASYGSSHKGYDTLAERPVAISKLKKAKTTTIGQNYGYTLQMMRADATRTVKITHPSILDIYDQLEDDEYFYVVSEFTGNPTISNMRTITTRDDVLTVMEVFEKVVGTLQYLNAHGITGCCVQQENIHISPSGEIEIDNLFLCRFNLIDNISNLGRQISSLAIYKNRAFSDQLLNERLDVKLAGEVLKSLLYLVKRQQGQDGNLTEDPPKTRKDASQVLMPKIDNIVNKFGSATEEPTYKTIVEIATEVREITSYIKATKDDGKRVSLKSSGDRRTYLPGETIFREGDDPSEEAFIIEEGCIQILKRAPDGRELYLDVSRPGDMVGDMALIDNQPRMATARATEATTVAVITAEQFRRMLEKSDPISRKLIRVLTNRIRYQSSEIARLKSILGVGK